MHCSSDQSNPESDKTRFYKLPKFENINSKVRKSCQKSVSNSAKMLILNLFLLLLKLIAISQLKIKHHIFGPYKSFPVYDLLVQDVILVISVKPIVTLKLESMSM